MVVVCGDLLEGLSAGRPLVPPGLTRRRALLPAQPASLTAASHSLWQTASCARPPPPPGPPCRPCCLHPPPRLWTCWTSGGPSPCWWPWTRTRQPGCSRSWAPITPPPSCWCARGAARQQRPARLPFCLPVLSRDCCPALRYHTDPPCTGAQQPGPTTGDAAASHVLLAHLQNAPPPLQRLPTAAAAAAAARSGRSGNAPLWSPLAIYPPAPHPHPHTHTYTRR
jgi:hypothetical protein